MNTLVVNYAYEPIQIVGWQKAVYLLVTDKAEALVVADRLIRSVSMALPLPRIVRLKRYVRIRKRRRDVYRKSEVFARDNWQCQYCGVAVTRKTATIDHVLPRAQGGKTSWQNTVTACEPCNARKADRTPQQAKMGLRKEPVKPRWRDSVGGELADVYHNYLNGVYEDG